MKDPRSQAKCTGGRGTDPWCPACDPRRYPSVAKHRKDRLPTPVEKPGDKGAQKP